MAADGIVYVMSGYRGSNLQAIRLSDARGDIAGTDAIVWQLDRDGATVGQAATFAQWRDA